MLGRSIVAVCFIHRFQPEYEFATYRFDPVDAGPLRIPRYTEPFALLIGQLAYEGEGGPELAYQFQRFGK